MKNKHIVFLFSLFLFFLQCKNSTESVDEGYAAPVFPETKEITVECLNDSFIFDIGGIDQLDTLLICSGKTDINDYVFHFFSKNSGAYIKSFGTIGQGPCEISWPVMGYSTDRKEDKVYCYDAMQTKMVEYAIRNHNGEIVVEANEYMLPPETKNTRGDMCFSIGNGQFITAYSSFFGNSYRFIKTASVDTVSTCNEYPRLNEPDEFIAVEHSYFSYMGRLAVKPNGKKFVHATWSGCILEIFDCKETIRPSVTKRFFEPEYKVTKKNVKYPFVQCAENVVNGIWGMACTDARIYAKYRDDSRYKNSGTLIAVFDWEGNPAGMLHFDDGLYDVVIENNDKYGYAIMRDKKYEGIKLVKFKID